MSAPTLSTTVLVRRGLIQQPLTSVSTQCKLPVSLPQLLGLLQSAHAGGLPGTAAGALAGATAAQRVGGAQVPLGGGPRPGPATFGAR